MLQIPCESEAQTRITLACLRSTDRKMHNNQCKSLGQYYARQEENKNLLDTKNGTAN